MVHRTAKYDAIAKKRKATIETKKIIKEENAAIKEDLKSLAQDESVPLEEREARRQELSARQKIVNETEELSQMVTSVAWDSPITLTYNWVRRELTIKFDVKVFNYERAFY